MPSGTCSSPPSVTSCRGVWIWGPLGVGTSLRMSRVPLTCPHCSPNRAGFMQACESAYSGWRFSGGFRTWVKMSLVKTQEEDGREAVEFRQEVDSPQPPSHQHLKGDKREPEPGRKPFPGKQRKVPAFFCLQSSVLK